MTFQGIHFDEFLMTLSQCEGKEKERKVEPKKNVSVKQKKGNGEPKPKKPSKKKAMRNQNDVLRVYLSWV